MQEASKKIINNVNKLRILEKKRLDDCELYFLSDEEKSVMNGYRKADKKEKDLIKYILKLQHF